MGRRREGDKGLEKWFGHRLGELGAATYALFDEKGVELAAGGQNPFAVADRVATLLEVIGKSIEMGAQGSATEVQDRSFFFVPAGLAHEDVENRSGQGDAHL